MPRQGQFKSQHVVDEEGRECTSPHHEGEKYLTWDNFHKTRAGHKGRERRCKKCRAAEQKIRDAKKRAASVPARRKPNTWDTAGANAFLMGK